MQVACHFKRLLRALALRCLSLLVTLFQACLSSTRHVHFFNYFLLGSSHDYPYAVSTHVSCNAPRNFFSSHVADELDLVRRVCRPVIQKVRRLKAKAKDEK